jgi:hypothetical protein
MPIYWVKENTKTWVDMLKDQLQSIAYLINNLGIIVANSEAWTFQ